MEESQLTIRPARPADVPALVRLWREMWDYHTPTDPRFQATPAANVVMEGWIEDNLHSERAAVIVAEDRSGEIAGYVCAMILENPPVVPWQFYGHLSEIAAHRRREGIGTRLVDAAHAWLRSKHVPYAEVNVAMLNPAARAFWRKQGYGDFLERLRRDL